MKFSLFFVCLSQNKLLSLQRITKDNAHFGLVTY